MLDAIEQEDRQELDRILRAFDFAIVIQTLVTWNLSNTDNQYKHDQDVLLDAKELLGPTVDHLNLIQIACFLFNEEMALDLLNFVAKASEELESKKILYEFMGKMWGDGNTTLHLASFLGMADLTKRLLDLGANVYKMNDRKYKPVDCADENTTKVLFLNLTEGQESLPTSPINDSGSGFNWGSFKSLGHMRSPSTSTLPLSMMASEDYHPTQYSEGSNGGLSLIRPASTLGITSQLCGPLITETIQSNQQQQQHQNQHQKTQAAQGARQDASDGLQRGSSGFIEDLLLTESRPSQESGDDEESILSPMILTKPEASLTSISSASTPTPESSSTTSSATTITTQINMKPTEAGESISAKDSTEQTKPVDSHLMPLNTSILPTCAISSYVSHIRPKLRSYQSSPSIRLYVETSVSKESASTSKPKKSHNTKKVSFEPRAVMADASRMGDLELYKSMLEILLEDKEKDDSEALEEIINHQSASRKLSSLHLAASYNHLALCQFLVERGANVNLSDMEGWTPMHCAAAEGHLEVFEFLVKEPDADLQATTFDGELLEDVVEDDDLRQRVIDIIEAQPRA
ncbi:hypothetical protein BGZ51_006038 [Haplosporangium sp. Z 767]|nr:hypothetical protein BGZ51_006038 [Haplosporangium sp. Z 767]